MVPWARFRRSKAAVKMHTLLDLHGSIPTFIRITEGKTHDVNILDSRLSALQAGGQRSIERELVYVDNLLLVYFHLWLRQGFQEFNKVTLILV